RLDAVDNDPTSIVLLYMVDAPNESRLSGAGGPAKYDLLSFCDVKIDIAQSREAAEPLHQVLDNDNCIGPSSLADILLRHIHLPECEVVHFVHWLSMCRGKGISLSK